MTNFNFLSKSSSQSCGHSSVTLAMTVGSPSAHRRGTMLKLLSVLVLILTVGVGQMWGAEKSFTFTPTSSSEGSTSGNVPTGVTCSYENTYGTNQCTKSNSFSFSTSGMSSLNITKVTVSLSKSSKGVGTTTVKIGSNTVGTRSSYNQSTTSGTGYDFNNTNEYSGDVSISCPVSTSSIYFWGVTIYYEETETPSCNTLAAPTNPSSDPDQTSVDLSWDAVTGAQGYKLTFDGTDYNIASGTTTKTITGLTMETEYHWTVAAKGDGTTNCALGTATAEQSVTTLDACLDDKATYTVTSKTTVSASGAPSGTSVSFNNNGSNNNDQMIAGKRMLLTLTGYEGKKIKGLTLSMHSNGSQGAGTFSMDIGSTTVAAISSATNFDKWYDNTSFGTDYRKVHVDLNDVVTVGKNENIVITITGTTNSLYCESFAICYESCTSLGSIKGSFF